MGPEGGVGLVWLRDEYGGRVLRNASAIIAEREALRMGIEHLTVLFPTEVSSFDFQVECTDRTVQYKLSAQSLRLFGVHRDVNDAHRAGANRLQNKQTNMTVTTKVVKEYGCSTCYSRNVSVRSCRRLRQSRDGNVM